MMLIAIILSGQLFRKLLKSHHPIIVSTRGYREKMYSNIFTQNIGNKFFEGVHGNGHSYKKQKK